MSWPTIAHVSESQRYASQRTTQAAWIEPTGIAAMKNNGFIRVILGSRYLRTAGDWPALLIRTETPIFRTPALLHAASTLATL